MTFMTRDRTVFLSLLRSRNQKLEEEKEQLQQENKKLLEELEEKDFEIEELQNALEEMGSQLSYYKPRIHSASLDPG